MTFILSWLKKLDINYTTLWLRIGASDLHKLSVDEDKQKWDYVMEQRDGEWARDTIR